MMQRSYSPLLGLLVWAFVGCCSVPASAAEDWSGIRTKYYREWGVFVSFVAGDLERERPSAEIGALVVAVAKGSAADEANLARGDWLVRAFNGEIFDKSGEAVSFLIEREGNRYSVTFTTRDHSLDDQYFVQSDKAEGGPRRLVVDRTGEGDYRTITRALSVARPGDTVTVRKALYREELVPPCGVTLSAESDGMVCIESPNSIGVWGVENVVLRRLNLRGASSKGSPLKALHANGLRLEQLTISSEGDDPLIWLERTNDVMISDCSLHGDRQKQGVRLKTSQADIRDTVILQCKEAVLGHTQSLIKSRDNLLDGNVLGIRAFDSSLTVEATTIVGNGPDQGAGVVAVNSNVLLRDNVVRRQETGISAARSQGTIQANVLAQCNNGLVVGSSALSVNDNSVTRNKGIGILLQADQNAAAPSVRTTIANNLIQFNAGSGITVRDHATGIFQNVIEGNRFGIRLVQGPADVVRNTIVLQRGTGFCADAGARGRISNNILAFGFVGMRIDRRSSLQRHSNVVYGNLGSKESPLVDFNYVREDRLPLSNGDLLAVLVYPAADLKAEGDLSVDPRFVKLGSDYRLSPDSPLHTAKGKDGATIGAFSPDDPLLEFRDALPQGLSSFFGRFSVKPWTELEKRHVVETFAKVRQTAPGLYARATAYGPILLWRDRSPRKAATLATARWHYNGVSFPDAAFDDVPDQPLSGTLIHELTHLVDGDQRLER
ncbi:MAG: right-handed parallel beta-helix repeat-containing protein, partial [Planctomycetaceae bacterium]|nr:right-handed parallel beta-helix repeat-containing protein [Planctomycetaceae bacterium]